MNPRETLHLWFSSFADGDMEVARGLWWDSADLHAPDGGFHGGFDMFLDWYARRRDVEGPGFCWQVDDVLDGDHHAAAVLRLRSDARPGGWDQHALYLIEEGTIRELWLHESGRPD